MRPLDVALDTAVAVLRNGGPTAEAERCFSKISEALGVKARISVWRLDCLAGLEERDGERAAFLRPVGATTLDLSRVGEIRALADRAAAGAADARTLEAELTAASAPSPAGRPLRSILAAAACAAFLCQVAQGDAAASAIALAAGALGQAARLLLGPRLPPLAGTLGAALLSEIVACVGLRLGWSSTPGPLLLASVVYAIPSVGVIQGFLDLLTRRYRLLGAGRLLDAGLVFLVLALALALAHAIVL
ncbi:MAG TPA: threonine/serine exporter family protein [Candidatus Polarisedimenticolaceae bacterium]|nr:threonine/serine exporter family protein [Candidatus Polarisedimenticolaceae bacterium]